jgi:arabinosaccharide transport system permease protein
MLKKIFYNQKIAPYMFILPFILVFAVFFIYPIISTVSLSLQDVLPGMSEFIGLRNYKRLFADRIFFVAVANSFKYMVVTCVLLIPIPMVYAAMLDSRHIRFSTFFKSLLYLPALTSVVVAGMIFRMSFGDPATSIVNQVVGFFGVQPQAWLRIPASFWVLIILCCWRWTGVNAMYYLSGLKNIPSELYESADIDGASGINKFFYITMPMLKPTTIYVLTISVYAGLAMFVESFMLWNGGNSHNNMGLTIVGYLYRTGLERNQLGYGSTVGIVLLVIAMAFNVFQLYLNGIFKKEDR